MATVIDELVIVLGLDPKKLNEGQKEALASYRKFKEDAAKESAKAAKAEELARKKEEDARARAAKKAEEEGRRIAEGYFDRIKDSALNLFAVLVGAGSLEKFVANTVTGLTNVQNAAIAVGVSAKDLQAFSAVIEFMGGSAATARDEMTGIAKVMEEWRTLGKNPGLDFLVAFNAVGGDINDSPLALYQKLAKFAETEPDKAKVSQYSRYLGFGQDAEAAEAQKGQVAVLNDLRNAMDRVPTDADIDKVTRLGRAWRGLGQALKFALTQELAGLSGPLSGLADWLNPQTRPAGDKLAAGLRLAFGPVIGTLMGYDEKRAAEDWAIVNGKSGKSSVAPTNLADWQSRFRAAQAADGGGFSPGVEAALFAESRNNPAAFNGTGGGQGALGIAQWRGQRLRELQVFAASKGKSWGDAGVQRDFIRWEATHKEAGHWAQIMAAPTEAERAKRFIELYERPGAGIAGDIRRALSYLRGHAARGGGAPMSVTVGAVNIHTAATDAKGIAKEVKGALSDVLVQQVNWGLSS